MSERHVVIVGGGLAGLSAGCYARAAGLLTTVVEHNIALGGVCTAWPRGPYTVDGCIHGLTGGNFAPLYEELGIVPPGQLHVLKVWTAYRDARTGRTLHVTRDLDALGGGGVSVLPTGLVGSTTEISISATDSSDVASDGRDVDGNDVVLDWLGMSHSAACREAARANASASEDDRSAERVRVAGVSSRAIMNVNVIAQVASSRTRERVWCCFQLAAKLTVTISMFG